LADTSAERYQDLVEAVSLGGFWDRDSTFFFCKAFEKPYPFVLAETVGEYMSNAAPDLYDAPLSAGEQRSDEC
jgi:hypothetical protein